MNDIELLSSEDTCNNNSSPMLVRSKIPQLRSAKNSPQSSVISTSYLKVFQESLSRTTSREDIRLSVTASAHAERWKVKYQDTDKKCKVLLVRNEKSKYYYLNSILYNLFDLCIK